MLIALIVTLVIVLLAAAIISASTTTSTQATREHSRSVALAAADAGLAAAVHRLGSQAEQSTAQQEDCFTVEFKAKSGQCPGQEEEIASSLKFTYYVSPAMKSNECTGLWIKAPEGKTITQRCITAVGEDNGTKARVEERVADVKGTGTFPVSGIFTYNELDVNNELKFTGEMATGGNLILNNEVESTGSIAIKYGGTLTGGSQCKASCTATQLSASELLVEPYKLPEENAKPFEEAESSNNNKNMTITGGGGTLNAGRELTANNEVAIKIPSGTYDLCYLETNNKATIEYTPPVTIYLDDHYRSGSTCANNSNSGRIAFNNEVTWIDTATTKSPSDLRIFVWGEPKETKQAAGSTNELKFNNAIGGPWYAEIDAPYSYVNVNNEFTMDGSIAAGSMKLNNKVTFVGARGAGESGQTGQLFFASAYHQCPPTYTSNPATGCY